MKSVLFLLFSFGLLASGFGVETPARWQTVDQRFHFSSSKSFYHCDYVEARANDILVQLGAQNLKVECRGGLPDWSGNWIYLTYDVVVSAAADKATTTARAMDQVLGFNEACDLHERLVRNILPSFEVYDSVKRGTCWDSQGRLSYEVKLLKAN